MNDAMSISPRLGVMLNKLRRYYDADLVQTVLDDAEHKAIERGSVCVTVADWDAVMDDQPIEGGYRIVSSAWVDSLEMLMRRD